MQKKSKLLSFHQLLKLAGKGDLQSIQKAIAENPALINQKSEGHHRTLLWEAVNGNKKELVQFLIKKGADVNIAGRYRNETFVVLKPYCIAILENKKELPSILLKNGHQNDVFTLAFLGETDSLKKQISLDKNLINSIQKEDTNWQTTLLHYAFAGQQFKTAKLLIEQGAKVVEHSELLYEIACRLNRFDLVELISEVGGIPSKASVFSVMYHHNLPLIDFFFKQGLNPNKPYVHNWPPIVYLSRGDKGEHPEKVATLLKYGANVHAQTTKGVSALHAAAKAGFLSVVKVLIANNANIYLEDKKGLTALDYAQKFGRQVIVDYLKGLK